MKLSIWAEDYERRHGKIYCPERVQNNERRRNKEWVKHKAESRALNRQVKKAQSGKLWDRYRSERDARKGELKDDLRKLEAKRRRKVAVRKQHIREKYTPLWAALYKRQKEEKRNYAQHFVTRFKMARQDSNSGIAGALLRAVFHDAWTHKAMLKRHKEEQREISKGHGFEAYRAVRAINNECYREVATLKQQSKDQQKGRLDQTKAEAKEIWTAPLEKEKQRPAPARSLTPKPPKIKGRRMLPPIKTPPQATPDKAAEKDKATTQGQKFGTPEYHPMDEKKGLAKQGFEAATNDNATNDNKLESVKKTEQEQYHEDRKTRKRKRNRSKNRKPRDRDFGKEIDR